MYTALTKVNETELWLQSGMRGVPLGNLCNHSLLSFDFVLFWLGMSIHDTWCIEKVNIDIVGRVSCPTYIPGAINIFFMYFFSFWLRMINDGGKMSTALTNVNVTELWTLGGGCGYPWGIFVTVHYCLLIFSIHDKPVIWSWFLWRSFAPGCLLWPLKGYVKHWYFFFLHWLSMVNDVGTCFF